MGQEQGEAEKVTERGEQQRRLCFEEGHKARSNVCGAHMEPIAILVSACY